jgi:GNAT superfamily N-acetyltransferase
VAAFVIQEVRDLDAVWHEIGPLFEAQYEFHRELMSLRRLPIWREIMRERIRFGPDALVLVARADGKAVGLLNGVVTRNPFLTEETYFYIDNVFVVEEARRLGIARSLVERAEAWSRAQGIDQLQLVVVAPNDVGLATWQGTGFRTSSYRMVKWLTGAG